MQLIKEQWEKKGSVLNKSFTMYLAWILYLSWPRHCVIWDVYRIRLHEQCIQYAHNQVIVNTNKTIQSKKLIEFLLKNNFFSFDNDMHAVIHSQYKYFVQNLFLLLVSKMILMAQPIASLRHPHDNMTNRQVTSYGNFHFCNHFVLWDILNMK